MPTKGGKSTRQDKQKMVERLTKKSHFKKLEVEKLLEVRKKLCNAAGRLDRNKFRDFLHSAFSITDDTLSDRVFRTFDKDNDTYLNEEEWVTGMSVFLRGSLEEKCRHCFDVYDLNSDGFITREEMFQFLKDCIVLHGTDQDDPDEGSKDIVEMALKKMDIDRDNRLSYADFMGSVTDEDLLLEVLGQCLPRCNTLTYIMTSKSLEGKQQVDTRQPPCRAEEEIVTDEGLWPKRLKEMDQEAFLNQICDDYHMGKGHGYTK